MPGNSARSPEGTPLPRASAGRSGRSGRLGRCGRLRIAPIVPAPVPPSFSASVPTSLFAAVLAIALVTAASACAPAIETPAEAGLRRDLRDAERIAAQLRLLPMVEAASVTVTRAVDDPLRPRAAPGVTSAATASVVLVLDPRADALTLTADTRTLVTSIVPEVPATAVAVLARPSAPPVELARLGPFQVAPSSRTPLLAALLGLLALCAALGGALALRERARRAAP